MDSDSYSKLFQKNSEAIMKLLKNDLDIAVKIYMRQCNQVLSNVSFDQVKELLQSVAACFFSGYMLGFTDLNKLQKKDGDQEELSRIQEIYELFEENTALAKENLEGIKAEIRNREDNRN